MTDFSKMLKLGDGYKNAITLCQTKSDLSLGENLIYEDLLEWFNSNGIDREWRKDFSKTQSPFWIWLSEVLCQQTVISVAESAYIRIKNRIKNERGLIDLSESEWQFLVAGLGYYSRFRRFRLAVTQLFDERSGGFSWPRGYKEWLNLPGIGPYTAAAISSICDNENVIAIDGNSERVLSRYFCISEPKSSLQLRSKILERSSEFLKCDQPGNLNQAFMELGQTVCRPKNPDCPSCPMQGGCRAFFQGEVDLYPGAKIYKRPNKLDLFCLLIYRGKDVLIEHRDKSSFFLKGTRGFPLRKWEELPLKYQKTSTEPVPIKHSIMNYSININILPILGCGDPSEFLLTTQTPSESPFDWVDVKEIHSYLQTSLDRKVNLRSHPKIV